MGCCTIAPCRSGNHQIPSRRPSRTSRRGDPRVLASWIARSGLQPTSLLPCQLSVVRTNKPRREIQFLFSTVSGRREVDRRTLLNALRKPATSATRPFLLVAGEQELARARNDTQTLWLAGRESPL